MKELFSHHFVLADALRQINYFFPLFFQTLVTMFKHFQNRTSLFLSREAIDLNLF